MEDLTTKILEQVIVVDFIGFLEQIEVISARDMLSLRQMMYPESQVERVHSLRIFNEDHINSLYLQYKSFDHVDLMTYPIDISLAQQLPENMAKRLNAIVLSAKANNCIEIAMVDPTKHRVAEELSHILGRFVNIKLASKAQIEKMQHHVYHEESTLDSVKARLRNDLYLTHYGLSSSPFGLTASLSNYCQIGDSDILDDVCRALDLEIVLLRLQEILGLVKDGFLLQTYESIAQ